MRWQTLASSSRFSKLDFALRKLLRLDAVSDVGLSGWRLYILMLVSSMRLWLSKD